MKNDRIYFTKEEVLNITQDQLPLAVLSRNYYSNFAAEISRFDRSVWNHFMWMIHPGKFVSQDWVLHEVPAENYMKGEHQLKFWSSVNWREEDRRSLVRNLEDELSEPWWKNRYDVLQLLGIKFHIRGLQIPWMRICSDWGDRLKIVDRDFIGCHLTPGEINRWFEGRANLGYVAGRYYPED
jgi:hypothetical protein